MAKKVNVCKSCGAQLSGNSKFCPNCGAKAKKRGSLAATLIVIFVVLLVAFIAILFGGDKETDAAAGTHTAAPSASAAPAATPSEPAATAAPAKEDSIVLSDDDFATVTFERIYEVEGITDCFYLQLNIENKADCEIWVYLDKMSVNDEMVPIVMSAVPTYILPGKSSRNPFIVSYSALSVSSVEDISQISFDVVIEDKETGAGLERIPGLTFSP